MKKIAFLTPVINWVRGLFNKKLNMLEDNEQLQATSSAATEIVVTVQDLKDNLWYPVPQVISVFTRAAVNSATHQQTPYINITLPANQTMTSRAITALLEGNATSIMIAVVSPMGSMELFCKPDGAATITYISLTNPTKKTKHRKDIESLLSTEGNDVQIKIPYKTMTFGKVGLPQPIGKNSQPKEEVVDAKED